MAQEQSWMGKTHDKMSAQELVDEYNYYSRKLCGGEWRDVPEDVFDDIKAWASNLRYNNIVVPSGNMEGRFELARIR